MNRAMLAVLLAASVLALGFLHGTTASAADAAPFTCAGISQIPGGATLASDRHGNLILVTSSGGVIRCDGTGAFDDLSAGGFGFGVVAGVQTFPGSTFISSFVVAQGLPGTWTLMQAKVFPDTNQFLVGYLGSNADQTTVFWRSFVGGPIETWINEGPAPTP